MKPWKNIVRKLFAFALVFVFVMSLTACSGNRDLPLKGQSDSKTEELKWDSKKHGIYEFADSVYATEGYDKVATITALSDFSLRLFEENMDLSREVKCFTLKREKATFHMFAEAALSITMLLTYVPLIGAILIAMFVLGG